MRRLQSCREKTELRVYSAPLFNIMQIKWNCISIEGTFVALEILKGNTKINHFNGRLMYLPHFCPR